MKHFSASLALLFVAAFLGSVRGDCSGHGELVDGVCCCNSGYASITPTDCDTYVGDGCLNSAPVPGDFNTPAAPPAVTSLAISTTNLVLTIAGPTVQDRGCTEVSLGTGTGLDPACTDFLKAVVATGSGPCDAGGETWSSTISWSDALTLCGFTLDTTSTVATVTYPTYYVYDNNVQVINTDTIPGSGGLTRVETSILPVRVRFPKQITVTTTIEVVAGIVLSAALISQSVDPTTLQATLVFSTSVNWPFQLTSASITLPSGFTQTTFTETTSTGACTSSALSSCTQTWTLVASPGSNCVLNGEYDITASDSCRTGMTGSDCPYASGDTIPTSLITADVVSENFCSVTDTGVVVTSALNTFSDSSFATSKATFAQSQTAYFKFTASSTTASISSVTLLSVSVSPDVNLLYDSGSGSSTNGVAASFAFDNEATYATFSFELDPTLFITSSSQNYIITATVDVAYSFQGSKRSMLYHFSSSSATQTGQAVQIAVSHQEAPASAAHSGSSSLVPALLASAGVIVGAMAVL